MYLSLDIPDITSHPKGFPNFWVKVAMIGSVSGSYQVNALASTYIRLVEAALVEYRLAHPALKDFWDTHDHVRLSAMHRAISHFETCSNTLLNS